MTPFVSIVLFRRDGRVVFKPPRKERPDTATQARKAASRFWSGNLRDTDQLVKIIVLREIAGTIHVSERGTQRDNDRPWVEFEVDIATAAKEPHLAACLDELGLDQDTPPTTVPDVLVINGHTYRRDI